MKITDLLKKQSICLDGKADSKEQVIREMVDLMAEGENINDIDTYRETVFKREEEGTTGIGEGIAIPHARPVSPILTWRRKVWKRKRKKWELPSR